MHTIVVYPELDTELYEKMNRAVRAIVRAESTFVLFGFGEDNLKIREARANHLEAVAVDQFKIDFPMFAHYDIALSRSYHVTEHVMHSDWHFTVKEK